MPACWSVSLTSSERFPRGSSIKTSRTTSAPGIIEELRVEQLGRSPVAKADYVRMRIPASGRASFERRLEKRFDFPAIHPRSVGHPHRYCWGADPWSGAGRSALCKLDVAK